MPGAPILAVPTSTAIDGRPAGFVVKIRPPKKYIPGKSGAGIEAHAEEHRPLTKFTAKLVGRITAEQLPDLPDLLRAERTPDLLLDLAEVTLVDREVGLQPALRGRPPSSRTVNKKGRIERRVRFSNGQCLFRFH